DTMVTLWEQRQPLPARPRRRLTCGAHSTPCARGGHDGTAPDRCGAAATARDAARVSRGAARDNARGGCDRGRSAAAAHRPGVRRRGPAGATRPDRVVRSGLRVRRGLDRSRHGQLRGRRPRRGGGEHPATAAVRMGDVVRFAVSAKQAGGRPMGDVPVEWALTAATGIAHIDAEGAFVAETPGLYTVTAALGSRTADALVRVEQRRVTRGIEVRAHLATRVRTAEV